MQECPFKPGDRVTYQFLGDIGKGEVIDSWQISGAWLVMVDDGVLEQAYTPDELTLDNSEAIHVDFQKKQRRT